MKLPSKGTSETDLLARMHEIRREDADWRGGKTFGLVYNAGDEVNTLLANVYQIFMQTNALSVAAFPSLRRFEAEILAITADLLHGPEAAGTLTSGGTESICMAIKTARDWARDHRPAVEHPEVVLPSTAHPAFHKGAHYFGVKTVTVPVDDKFQVDLDAVRDAVTENTILLVGSAPGFPQGVIDPIEKLAAIAQDRDILMHVDACLGGFMLPFLERLGHEIPAFDFRVPGVTSISADLHKYGFAAKGASTVMYRDNALRKYQFFTYVDWPGGIYGSPSMAGARGGGPIAGAWAVLHYLGEEGFVRMARATMETTARFLDGIRAINGLRILGEPAMSVFAFEADDLNVYALGDALDERGWHIDRQQLPPSIHMMVSPVHAQIVDSFLSDLEAGIEKVREEPESAAGMAAMYGMLASVPDRGSVRDFVLDFMDGWYRL